MKNTTINSIIEEKEKIQKAAEDPEKNIDFLFEKYEDTFVRFEIRSDKNYLSKEDNPIVFQTIQEIFKKYIECEYYRFRKDEKEYFFNMMLDRALLPNNTFGMFWDANYWRLGLNPLWDKEDFEKIIGFSIGIEANKEYYPTKYHPVCGVQDQLRYRILINEIKLILHDKKMQYEIKSKN